MTWFDEFVEDDGWGDKLQAILDKAQFSNTFQTEVDLIVAAWDEIQEEFVESRKTLNQLAYALGMPGYADITEVVCYALFTFPDPGGDMRLLPVRCRLCGECSRWVRENETIWVCEHTTDPEYEYAASLTRILDHFPDSDVVLSELSDVDAHIDWV